MNGRIDDLPALGCLEFLYFKAEQLNAANALRLVSI